MDPRFAFWIRSGLAPNQLRAAAADVGDEDGIISGKFERSRRAEESKFSFLLAGNNTDVPAELFPDRVAECRTVFGLPNGAGGHDADHPQAFFAREPRKFAERGQSAADRSGGQAAGIVDANADAGVFDFL